MSNVGQILEPARAFYDLARDHGFGRIVSTLIMVICCLIFYHARVRRLIADTDEVLVDE